jgi:hypothetical protein
VTVPPASVAHLNKTEMGVKLEELTPGTEVAGRAGSGSAKIVQVP